jgi:hypothetical protein
MKYGDLPGCNSNCRARHPGKLLYFQQSEQETGRFMQLACHPILANPRGEAIHARTLDCFTLRVRKDGRDHLNCAHLPLPVHTISGYRLSELPAGWSQYGTARREKQREGTFRRR